MSEQEYPRSKLDVLYKDMLGDVGMLVTRLEHITASVTACTEDAKKLPMDIRLTVAETGRQINAEGARSMNQAIERLEKLVAVADLKSASPRERRQPPIYLPVILALLSGAMVGFMSALLLISRAVG